MRTLWTALFAITVALAAPCVRADDQAFCKELLDKSIKAMGGEEKLAKLAVGTIATKGKIIANENVEANFTDMWHVRASDKFRVDMDATIKDGNLKVTFVFNGDKGWIRAANATQTQELPKEIVAAIKEGVHAARVVHRLAALKDKGVELSPLGELKIGDRDAVGLRVIQKGHPDLAVYFDKKTVLPIKTELRMSEGQGQDMAYEFLYEDYKDFDGLNLFSKVTFKRDGKMFLESEITELKPQDRLDDVLFDKP